MNKPPNPHPRLLQPSPDSITPDFLPLSAASTDRLLYLFKSILLCHHCFASCIPPPLSMMNWSPFQSCHLVSTQICFIIEDFLQFKSRSLGFILLTAPQGGFAVVMRGCVQISLKQFTDTHPPAVYGAN
uniref:Uncharacterized protein n=1 Tax=Opuntia streptacantha TaxID=393608 RepID=A0A7C9DTK8_OPUST